MQPPCRAVLRQLYMYIIDSYTLIPENLRKIVYFYSSFVLYYTRYRFIHSFS